MLDDAPRLTGSHLAPAPADSPPQLDVLSQVCLDEILEAFGLGRSRRVLEKTFRIPVRRLARQIVAYDAFVGESGLAAGGAWALERMARRVEVEGRENVPLDGPVLLVSNHPGLADALAIFASVPRPDLRVVAAERPFLQALPNTSRYLMTVAEGSSKFGVVRSATRHLLLGGTVLTFPGGKIEPDPAVLPGALESLERWSPSVDLFARLTPGLTVVPVVVSGVISPRALRNPLIHLRRRTEDQRWLAATIQMLFPALRDVNTRVSFGDPIRPGELEATPSRAVVEETRRLIGRHSG